MTWPIFVINMQNNNSRMKMAAEELSRCGLAYTRFEAVNGRALTEQRIAEVYDPAANTYRARHPMTGPELGCYLSHVELWKIIAAGDAAGGIILEDDFVAADDLATVIEAIAADTGNWELVKLFSARKNQKVLDLRPLAQGREIGVPYKVPNTTLGYAIRRDAAARLANLALPVSRPIDEDHKHFWEIGLKVALVTPSPLGFSSLSDEAGTITDTRRQKGKSSFAIKAKQAWRTSRFRMNYLFGLHWSRMVRGLR